MDYPRDPGAAPRKNRVQEQQEVAGDLFQDVEEPQVPGHVDPEQLVPGAHGFVLTPRQK